MAYNKYNSVKTEYKGIMYDSKKEAEKAQYLDMLLKTGEVLSWERQVEFIICPRCFYFGRLNRPNKMRLDFRIKFAPDSQSAKLYGATDIVLDTKGYATEEWKLKRKLFMYFYPNIKLIVE